ncbi:MAG: hypothetical protein IKP95_05540 [Ruminococcus sp.]|nr:hypothetical protein [Ruminococcus sp.]
MDIIGKWKIAESMRFLEVDGKLERVWQKAEDIIADESLDESDKQMLYADIYFVEGGEVQWVLPIPEGASQEEIDAAVAAGEITLFDDKHFVISSNSWKEEDGKLLFNTGIHGTILDEAVNPWDEIKDEGNGMIGIMMYHLAKAD